jgi:Flp pilus assembly protein TadD
MFKKATELAPKNIVAFASLGALYLTANRIDEAIEYFDKALYIDDSDGAVHADLAICYARKGKFDDAENEYAEAVKQKADNLEKFRAELNTLEGASVSK